MIRQAPLAPPAVPVRPPVKEEDETVGASSQSGGAVPSIGVSPPGGGPASDVSEDDKFEMEVEPVKDEIPTSDNLVDFLVALLANSDQMTTDTHHCLSESMLGMGRAGIKCYLENCLQFPIPGNTGGCYPQCWGTTTYLSPVHPNS